MRRTLLSVVILAMSLFPTQRVVAAGFGDSLSVAVRAGYNVGATTPMGMPSSIVSVDAFKPTPSFRIGSDVLLPLSGRWGLSAGLQIENKAMDADVTTKGYHMEMRRGSESLEGLFTGHVSQQVTQWMITLPVCGVYSLNPKLRLRAGLYGSLLLKKEFSGIASDGYIRKGGATGPKIDIGNTSSTWATYDFSDEMRTLQVGVLMGADWQPFPRLGFYFDLGFGYTGIFQSDFKTVEQTLYPVYGSLGLVFLLIR